MSEKTLMEIIDPVLRKGLIDTVELCANIADSYCPEFDTLKENMAARTAINTVVERMLRQRDMLLTKTPKGDINNILN